MIKLALIAVFVLSILGLIIYFTFQQSTPPIPTPEQKQETPVNLSTIKPEDIAIKEPQKPLFADLIAPKQTQPSGYVRLSEVAGKILIQLKSDDTTDKIAMIYKGACAVNGESIYPLVMLEEGKSQTVWKTDLDSVIKQLPLSVKVFKDSKNLTTYTRCANLVSP